MNSDMLTRRLQRRGFDITTAINGEDALLQTVQYKPDIILMDMSLPIMDSWEATRRLKEQISNNTYPSLPYQPMLV